MAQPRTKDPTTARYPLVVLGVVIATLFGGCGGGGSSSSSSSSAESMMAGSEATTGAALEFTLDAADAVAAITVAPAFHVAPVLLDEPDDADVIDAATSAQRAPTLQAVPPEQARLDTRGLTVDRIGGARMQALGMAGEQVAPMASSTTVTTYTPAQIRSAYGLPALPAAGATPSAEQAARLGAGQTIYIVDAYHDPNVAAELAAFNQKFGLPACATQAIAPQAKLPLAAASASGGCVFSVVYTTSAGAMTASAPGYHSGWATEIALDVQWAHATAPLARIVLIEAADASMNSLLGAIQLASKMGTGVVSMSFGAPEGNWTSSVDSAFATAGMSYLAATGDSGASVAWPSVSSRVLAVGGTTLTAVGNGSRSETTWSRTGGGISQFVATPTWQAAGLPGVGSVPRRGVADVAFNADPASGQYVALIAPGKSAAAWVSVGGTSLSTPQWAGLIAIANALRARSALAPLGAPHTALYRQIGAAPGTYANVFADIATGADGVCTLCTARAGYDVPTGLGTPNVASLLSVLGGAAAAAAAPAAPPPSLPPVITASAFTGVAQQSLTGTISVSDPAGLALTVTISGVPAGMVVKLGGAALTLTLTWASPVTGNYTIVVKATDAAGRSSSANVPVTITAKS